MKENYMQIAESGGQRGGNYTLSSGAYEATPEEAPTLRLII